MSPLICYLGKKKQLFSPRENYTGEIMFTKGGVTTANDVVFSAHDKTDLCSYSIAQK